MRHRHPPARSACGRPTAHCPTQVRGWLNRTAAWVTHCTLVPATTPTRSVSEAPRLLPLVLQAFMPELLPVIEPCPSSFEIFIRKSYAISPAIRRHAEPDWVRFARTGFVFKRVPRHVQQAHAVRRSFPRSACGGPTAPPAADQLPNPVQCPAPVSKPSRPSRPPAIQSASADQNLKSKIDEDLVLRPSRPASRETKPCADQIKHCVICVICVIASWEPNPGVQTASQA